MNAHDESETLIGPSDLGSVPGSARQPDDRPGFGVERDHVLWALARIRIHGKLDGQLIRNLVGRQCKAFGGMLENAVSRKPPAFGPPQLDVEGKVRVEMLA